MSIRRIEITEERLLDGAIEYFAGDIKSFPAEKANRWVELGWAKDVETGEQGERTPGANGLVKPDTIKTAVSAA
jgi:hypothetical protein